MPLLRSSTRPVPVQCFFCLSPSLLPPHPQSTNISPKGKNRISEVGTKWNWQCDRCGCWNIKDETGQMISDLPAMHDSAYNERSFSLRATPSSSHLPSSSSSSSSTSLFCHSCLANQTLIMNMLANYLPDDDDPSYPMLYAELPLYLSKLHSRYPPVCRNCQPAVDEALRKSDHRAQVQAWSSALDRGARSPRKNDPAGGGEIGRVSRGDILIWRFRGGLWWISLGLTSAFPAKLTMILNIHPPTIPYLPFSLLLFNVLSIIWIAWDPYWLRRVRNRDKIKIEGRGLWVRNMMIMMLLRISGSAISCFITDHETSSPFLLKLLQLTFSLEIALLIHSLMSIKTSQPVSIKLVRPVSVTLDSTSVQPSSSIPNGHDLSSLSLSSSQSQTQITYTNNGVNPIFGRPSLHKPLSEMPADGEPMDWEPTRQQSNRYPLFSPKSEYDEGEVYQGKENWDTFGTNKQRMFHKNDETGLENLLAGWGIGGPSTIHANTQPNGMTHNAAPKQKKRRSNNRWLVLDVIGTSMLMFRGSGLITMLMINIFKIHIENDEEAFDWINHWTLAVELCLVILSKSLVYLYQYLRQPNYHNRGVEMDKDSIIKISWLLLDMTLRTTSLAFTRNARSKEWIGTTTMIGDERWRITLEWLLWGIMDGVTMMKM
ncbi:hypothetical protein L486_07924 [Kwoniella mangroviensis CBS 10435]|uniref:Ima1 N-terminal domain-containing protein n=1 Tax=Kwoniella mangroviensis CBS 10435 TaxID=1331196 RepID=A0A1B9IGH1_9TREE|nr:hypothetical protein L486_07924 [Kwoniella mangroviensis CBS 10435]